MDTLPAICNHCGAIFHSNAIGVGPGISGLVIENVTVGPCPNCGSDGRIPDGTYDTVRGTLRMLLKDRASAQALQNLARILQAARETRAEPATVADRVEDEVPELSEFARAVRTLDLKNWQWWLIFLITFIQMLADLGAIGPEPQTISDQQIERTMRRVLEQPTTSPGTPTLTPTTTERPGRNDLCPCGSGKKYKRCHLRSTP
jgi:hypothetical protein